MILFDNLVGNPATTYRRVLEFLGVDTTFVPTFRVMNPNKRIRNPIVKRVLGEVMDPSTRILRTGSSLIPVRAVCRHPQAFRADG